MLQPLHALAQNSKTKRADQSYESGAYFKAITEYQKVFNKIKDRTEKGVIAYKLGECYRFTGDPKNAGRWYTRAVRYKYNEPNALLYAAEMQKMQGEYEEAKEQYLGYLELLPNDLQATQAMAACDSAIKWIENPTRHIIEPAKWLNSRSSDFSPALFKNNATVYFTSSREASKGKKTSNVTGTFYTDIFITKRDRKNKWSEPVPIEGEINTEFDEGTVSFTDTYDAIYYTSCQKDKESGAALGCAIYFAKRAGDGWGTPKKLQLFNDSSVSFGHPAISPDGLSMAFVSQKDGGKSSKDIWITTRTGKSGTWQKPTNMGEPINSPGNEIFPTWRNDTTLYFSSDYHPGMGGLDIFSATKRKDGKWYIQNLKHPMNSASDDFSAVFYKNENRGYFCSSRERSDNIFSFELPSLEFTIVGTVRNDQNRKILANASVQIFGSDGTFLELKTSADGKYKFKLKEKTDYRLLTSLEEYLKGKGSETTKGYTENKDLELDIFMRPINIPIELPNIMYDFGKADLRPESIVALDELVETLNDNPNITIELAAHTDYVGKDADNETLSQDRAQAVVDHLIKNDIAADRLTAKGYGESQPKEVNDKINKQYKFLRKGTVLNQDFITNQLTEEAEKEMANQINRRTEFSVLTTDYKPKRK